MPAGGLFGLAAGRAGEGEIAALGRGRYRRSVNSPKTMVARAATVQRRNFAPPQLGERDKGRQLIEERRGTLCFLEDHRRWGRILRLVEVS